MKARASIFVAAIFVRVLFLHHFYASVASTEYLNEVVAIAKSLLLTHTFGGVYGRPQPTAWLAPGYPALVALVFWLFGVGTAKATTVLLSLNGLFSALTAVAAYDLGKRFISHTAGLVAGFSWALSGYVASVSALLWDTSLSTLLLTLAVLLTLSSCNSKCASRWVTVGAFWGLAALVCPAVLAPFAVMLLYFARRRLRLVFLAGMVCALILVPWSVRNWHIFHQLFLIRDNMWAEIYFGNTSYALHPMGDSGVYQRMGEGPFLEMLKQQTLQWISSHPRDFAVQSTSRALRFWTLPRFADGTAPVCLGVFGLALALYQRRSWAVPLLLMMATYPLVYYMSVVFSRFRYLIDPIVYIFAGYGLQSIMEFTKVLIRHHGQREHLPAMQSSSESS